MMLSSMDFESIASRTKCWRGESNSHGFPHTILSRARLPIPPLQHFERDKSASASWRTATAASFIRDESVIFTPYQNQLESNNINERCLLGFWCGATTRP